VGGGRGELQQPALPAPSRRARISAPQPRETPECGGRREAAPPQGARPGEEPIRPFPRRSEPLIGVPQLSGVGRRTDCSSCRRDLGADRVAPLTPAESPINSRGYGFFRLTAAEPMGRPASAAVWLFRPVAPRHSREPTQDNSTSSAACSARLGSPLALQRRAHPGGSGWIPARVWVPGPPAFVFPDLRIPAGADVSHDGCRDRHLTG
jgi:hypothetical protein